VLSHQRAFFQVKINSSRIHGHKQDVVWGAQSETLSWACQGLLGCSLIQALWILAMFWP